MKRKHSKIDKLPADIKEAVEQMILGDYTYRDVCDFVRDTANVTLSEAAVCRYAQGLNASVQEIRLASENMRALTEEMQKFPQLDTTEGIARLISHKVLQAVQQMDEIALKEADPLKLIEKATALIRAVTQTYKPQALGGYGRIRGRAYSRIRRQSGYSGNCFWLHTQRRGGSRVRHRRGTYRRSAQGGQRRWQ